MVLSQTPAYNLKAVLKETGIAADTLRAWERRYGIPKPQRTPGGHRLYSQHDIHLIKWLMARQAEGLSISRAVDQWNESIASGTNPLAASRAPGISTSLAPSTTTTNIDMLRLQWLSACLTFNESTAEQTLNQAFALYSVEMVTKDLIQRALHEVGAMWQRGEATVQQEHYMSSLATRRLDSLIAAAPPPIHPQTILLACPPNEWHALPLLFLNLLLRRRGWNVVYLGANVPTAQLEETVQTVQPSVVVMAAQQLMTAARLRDVSVLLAGQGVSLAYGGRAFNQIPEVRGHVYGEFLGDDLQVAVERIEQLVEEPLKVHANLSQGPRSSPEAEAYRQHRKLIESTLQQRFAQPGPVADNLAVADLHFGNALEAALDLGNVAYLETDLSWIKSILVANRLPAESLRFYLTAYAETLREVIGASMAEVSDWIETHLVKI